MFKKAMKINPTYAEAYFNLGNYTVTMIKTLYIAISIGDIDLTA